MKLMLENEASTLALAGRLFRQLRPGMLVYLHGTLGAGKTTFVRGCLRDTGYPGAVKSPTYTLVEEYRLGQLTLFHFDLYRLADPEELEWMGIRDYFTSDAICFIEWPERGGGALPKPDIRLMLTPQGAGRILEISAETEPGRRALASMQPSDET